jgi:hypothetical protein
MPLRPHTHTCTQCGASFPCAIDCDSIEDGGDVCAACAERAFDAIERTIIRSTN